MNDVYFAQLSLPEMAMSINGTFLERRFLGYRTSNVIGRDELLIDYEELEVGYADGARFQRMRLEPRDIIITFAMTARTGPLLKKMINELKHVLYLKNAQFIFNDELDVFFTGTVVKVTSERINAAGSGVTSTNGEIHIRCSDPCKYSVREFIVFPVADEGRTFIVDYHGTYPAHPILEATTHSDNGFIGFINNERQTLQFGDPEELDRVQYQRNETLVNGTPAVVRDTGISRENPANTTQGTMSGVAIPGGVFNNQNFLRLATRGLGTGGIWNGAMTTWQVPADSVGVRGSRNFIVASQHRFETVDFFTQTGAQTMAFLNAANQVIFAVSINKGTISANTAHIDFWGPNRQLLRQFTFQPSMFAEDTERIRHRNPFNLLRGGRMEIRKEGQTITIAFDNQRFVHNVPAIANMECHQIQVWIGQFGGRNITPGGLATGGREYLGWNHFRLNSFVKQNVQRWRNVPNKFTSGSDLWVDCRNGEVRLRGVMQYGLGALGNDWENFALTEGVNQIHCIHSTWATHPPTYRMRYREVFV